MKFHGIQVQEGSNISNLTVASGTAFPASPNAGEVFYRSDADTRVRGLYLYTTAWERIASADSITAPSGTSFPALANTGDIFYKDSNDSTEGLYVYSGSAWIPAASGTGSTLTVTGDVSGTLTVGSGGTLSLGTVGSNATVGDASHSVTLTVTDKGLTTSASSVAINIDASQVGTGTFADARIAQSNVTQHQAALSLNASQTTAGTFADARIAQSNVTQHQAALSIAETQVTDGTILARVGANETVTGNWQFNNPVTVATPTTGSSAATKDYVDQAIAGLSWKNSVLVATTANISLSGTQTIDGVAVVAGNRVLVKNQTTAAQNGIYVVASGPWARATDFDQTSPLDEVNSAAVYVQLGTTQADTGWTQTAAVTTVGSDAMTFVQFAGTNTILAGAGLVLSGNSFNVGTASTSRIVVNTDDIDLATVADAGTGSFLKLTRDSYGRVSGTAAVTTADITSLVDGTYVNVTGDTMTGTLTIAPASGTGSSILIRSNNALAQLVIDQTVSGFGAKTYFKTNALARWSLGSTSTAETGTNTGSNFSIDRYDDTGTYIDTPFSIARATGLTTISKDLYVSNTAPVVYMNANAASNAASIQFRSVNSARWLIGKSSTAETGSNVGSNFLISRYDDTATFVDSPFQINRATGQTVITNLSATGSLTGAASLNVLKAGDTMTGTLTISNPSASSYLALNGNSGTAKAILLETGGSLRWIIGASNTAESGSNAGSDFNIYRYDDTGTALSTPFNISRATGNITLSGSVGIGTAPDADLTIANSSTGGIHLAPTTGDVGGYLNSTGTTELMVSGGASYNSYSAPNFVMNAKAAQASGMYLSAGGISFWGNTGLTAGTTFNQTQLMSITTSGVSIPGTLGVTGTTTVAGIVGSGTLQLTSTSAVHKVGGLNFMASNGSTSNYLYAGSSNLVVRNQADTANLAIIDSTGITANLTGAASLNVLKSGDTMSGDLVHNNAVYLSGKTSAGTITRLFGVNGSNNLYIGGVDTTLGDTLFVNNGVELARIGATGNIGIGRASSGNKVEIQGTTVALYDSVGTNWLTLSPSALNNPSQINGNSGLSLRTVGTEAIRIDTSQNVLIGTASQLNGAVPASRLNVNGTITAGSASSTSGSTILQGYYSTTGALTNFGSERSSGGPMIGYAVVPSTTTAAFNSSTTINAARTATIWSDNIKFYTGAAQTVAVGSQTTMTEWMRLTNVGYLGVGTTSPVYRLVVSNGGAEGVEINPTGGNGGGSFLQSYNRSTSAYLAHTNYASQWFWANGTATLMNLDTSGVLGLAVTPAGWDGAYYSALQIGGHGASISAWKPALTSTKVLNITNNGYQIYSAGPIWKYTSTGPSAMYSQVDNEHRWSVAASGTAGSNFTPTQAMTLSSAGNLGIGTTPNGSYKLQVNGGSFSTGLNVGTGGGVNSAFTATFDTDGAGTARFYSRASSTLGDLGIFSWHLCSADGTSDLERMKLDSSGLTLSGTFTALGEGTGYYSSDTCYVASGIFQVISISSGTQVFGLDNSNSTFLMDGSNVVNHASGTASGTKYFNFGYNATSIGSITQSGTTAVLYNTTSDERLKENIVPAQSASTLIDQIQVREFDFKNSSDHVRFGFIAQELVQVVPEAVHAPEDPEEMMAVDYSKLVPLLVKEIQELRARIAALESK